MFGRFFEKKNEAPQKVVEVPRKVEIGKIKAGDKVRIKQTDEQWVDSTVKGVDLENVSIRTAPVHVGDYIVDEFTPDQMWYEGDVLHIDPKLSRSSMLPAEHPKDPAA